MKNGIIRHNKVLFKWASCLVAVAFFLTTVLPSRAFAQGLLGLPTPGTPVSLSAGFIPVIVRGIRTYPDNPLKFDFIVDSGESGLKGDALKAESEKLIRYFLASLTLPENDLWVNLSPYEKDRIVPDSLGVTEMGRDMLAQDYLLKQIAASLTNPESDLGKQFWDKVYQKSYEQYGTTNIPVDTFNKVWIMPSKATVYEDGDKAFVVESKLKVLLEEDYVALQNDQSQSIISGSGQRSTTKNSLASSIVREVFIPALEKEVNEGKNFANLRQIYNSLVLAYWFKSNLKNAVLNKVYADQDKVRGIDLSSKETTEKVYAQYLETFKKGVCNIMKVELDPYTKRSIPRKYFAGGVVGKFGPGEVQIVRNGTVEGRAGSSALLNQLKTATIVLMTVALNLLNTGNLSAQDQNKNLPSSSYRTPVSAEKANGSLFYENDGYGKQAAKMGVIQGSLWKSVKEVAWQRAALSLTNRETSELLRILLAENPDLENPDRIRSGQTFDMHDVVNAIEVKYHLDHAKLVYGQKIKNGDKTIEVFFLDSLGNKPNKYADSYHGINFDDKIVVFSFAIAQWAEEAGKGYSSEGREDLFARYLKDVVRHEVLHAFLYPKIDQGLYKSPVMESLFQKYSISSDQYYRVTEELAAYLGQIAKTEDPRLTLADFLWKMSQPGKLGDIYASVRTIILEEMFQKLNKGDWREAWGSSGYSSEQEFLGSLGVTDEEFNKAAQELFEKYFGSMPEFDLEIPDEVVENYREKYQHRDRGGASSSLLSEDDLAMQFLFSTENVLRDEAYFQDIVQTDKIFVKTLFDINFDPKSTAQDKKVLQDVLLAKGYAFELNQETAAAIAYPLEGEKLGIKAIYDIPTGVHVFLKGRHFDVAKLVNPKMSETLGFEYQLVKVDGKYAIAGAQFSSGGLDFMTFKAPYSQVQLTREMLDKSAQQMNRCIGLSFQKGADIYGVSADYQSKLQSSASPLTSDSNSSDAKKYTSNRSAQDYRDNIYHAGLLDIFEFIKSTIKKKGKIRYYDAGTGLGVAPTEIKILYPREADVYGSDIDDKTINDVGENVLKSLYERFTPEEARKYFSGKRTFRYETGDVSEKKFLDESGQPVLMDLITSLYVLQYTQDPFKAWLNLFHQLADGGVFASQFLFFNDEQGLKNLATYRAIFNSMQDAGIQVQMSVPFVNEKGEISMFVSATRTGTQAIDLNIAVDAISEVEVQASNENRTYTVYEVSYVGLGDPQKIVQVRPSSPSAIMQPFDGLIASKPSQIDGPVSATGSVTRSSPSFYMTSMTAKEWGFFANLQQAVGQGQGRGIAISHPLEASINNCLCVVFPEKKTMFHFTELNYLASPNKNKISFLKAMFSGLSEDSAIIVDNRKTQHGITVEDIRGVLQHSVVVPESKETYRHILLSIDGRVLIVDEQENPEESASGIRTIYEKSVSLVDAWRDGSLGELYGVGDVPQLQGSSSSIPADLLKAAQYAALHVPPDLFHGCKIASDLIAPQDKPQNPRLAAAYGFLLQESIYVNGREHVFVDAGPWVIDTQLRQFKLPLAEEFIDRFVYEKGTYLKALWNYLDPATKAQYADIGIKIFMQEMATLDGQGARKNETQIRQLIQNFIKEEKQFIPVLRQLYFGEKLSQDARAIIEDALLEYGRAFELTDKTIEKIATLDKDGIWKFKAVVDTTNNSNIVVFFNERFEESDGNIMEHFKVAQGINKNVTKMLGLKYQAQKTSNGRFVITGADFFSSSLEMWVFQENTLTNAIVQGAHKAIRDHIKIKTQISESGAYTVSKPLLDKLAPGEKVVFNKPGEQLEIPFEEFQDDVGGIDFNSKNLDIERQGSASPAQFNASDLENIQIDGLYPIIINITPVTNLPLLLGARQKNAPQLSLAR